MPSLDFAILGDYVRSEGGLAHVLAAGIDTVFAPVVPTAQQIALVARFQFTRQECAQEYAIGVVFREADADLHILELRSTVSPEWTEDLPASWAVSANLAVNVALPLRGYGEYAVDLRLDDDLVKSIPLRVVGPDARPG